jgi:hypothetical protein
LHLRLKKLVEIRLREQFSKRLEDPGIPGDRDVLEASDPARLLDYEVWSGTFPVELLHQKYSTSDLPKSFSTQ